MCIPKDSGGPWPGALSENVQPDIPQMALGLIPVLTFVDGDHLPPALTAHLRS